MKLRYVTMAALSLLFVFTALAQDAWTTKATVSVPFKFVVNGTTLPAGDYRVSMYLGNRIQIQNIDQPDYAAFVQNRDIPLNSHTRLKDSSLVFVLTDGKHVLHQIAVMNDYHIHDIVHGTDIVDLVPTR